MHRTFGEIDEMNGNSNMFAIMDLAHDKNGRSGRN